MQGYSSKQIGIPQDDIGDMSRLLANFFLQDHDREMSKRAAKRKAGYFRFADDQLFSAGSAEDCTALLVEASKSLHGINLSINSGKVTHFSSRGDFELYWCFDLFELLEDLTNEIQLHKAIDLYLRLIEKGVSFRKTSALRRLLNIDFSILKATHRDVLEREFLQSEFLSHLRPFELQRLRKNLGDDERLFRQLDDIAGTILFNSYLYNLISLYREHRKDYDLAVLYEYVQRLKL